MKWDVQNLRGKCVGKVVGISFGVWRRERKRDRVGTSTSLNLFIMTKTVILVRVWTWTVDIKN